MNRRYFLFGSLRGSAACSRDRRPRLNVFNWSSYIAPDTVPKFEAEFGVRVRYGIYESNEEMLARVMGGNSGWDIVFPTGLYREADAGERAARAHPSRLLPNLGSWNRDSSVRIGIRISMVRPLYGDGGGHRLQPQTRSAAEAWADMWDERLRGRMTMLDDPFDTMGACSEEAGLFDEFQRSGELDARTGGGHPAEASAARLSERRGARPTGERRRAGGAHVEHHGAAGHGFVTERRLRVSGRRLRGVSGRVR